MIQAGENICKRINNKFKTSRDIHQIVLNTKIFYFPTFVNISNPSNKAKYLKTPGFLPNSTQSINHVQSCRRYVIIFSSICNCAIANWLVIGTNNVPLGPRKGTAAAAPVVERGRRKGNRWGPENEENKVANLINLPTSLGGVMTLEQQEAYSLNFRIEEITQKLWLNDVVPRESERSPSPPPQYDSNGKRTNTREVRYRKRLEDERHRLVEEATKTIPNYKLPTDYRKPQKTQEKIYIPVNDYPEINFIGLLIGPRGNTLKKMETESGAKIAIRGKGSVKEGKGRTDVGHQSSMDDDLHCLIIADDESKIQKAIELVNKVIETAASTPEEQNELKRGQLRELAALNGTLRDDEGTVCSTCGELGHRRYDCPNRQKNFTASVVCRICGNQGHFARDCKDRPSAGYGNSYRPNNVHQIGNVSSADREYEQLMLELGTGSAGSGSGRETRMIEGGESNPSGPRGGPAPWQQRSNNGRAPWKRRDHDSGNDRGNDRYNNNGDRYNNNDRYDRYNNNNGRYNNNDRYSGNDDHDRSNHDRYDNDRYSRSGGYGNNNGGRRYDNYQQQQQHQQPQHQQQQGFPQGPPQPPPAFNQLPQFPGFPQQLPGFQGPPGFTGGASAAPPGISQSHRPPPPGIGRSGPPGGAPPGSRPPPPPPGKSAAPPPGLPGAPPPPPSSS